MKFIESLAQFIDIPAFPWKKLLVGLSVGQFAFEGYLLWRQYGVLKRTKPLKALEDVVDREKFDKSQDYGRTKAKVGIVSSIYSQIENLGIVYYDVLPCMWSFAGGLVTRFAPVMLQGEILQSVVFFTTFNVISTILSLPISYYNTFVVEEKYGFNKQTVGLWAKDLLTGQALGVVLGGPIIAGLLKIVHLTGTTSFYMVWLFLAFVQVASIIIYPILIVPLFNKLSPLEPGKLKDEVEKLAQRLEFPLDKLYTMDGSKRSGHSNAHFYGLPWCSKHIVIYDTLLEKSSTEEILAVLGHELGHSKLGHTTKMAIVTQGYIFVSCALLSTFLLNKSLFEAFGFIGEQPILIGFLLFSDFQAPMDVVLSYFMNYMTRKHEYEADAFAKDLGYADDLAKSLVKLQEQNLSTLDADWMYSNYHYTHPLLIERLRAIGWTNAKITIEEEKKLDSDVPVKASDREL